MVGEPGACLRRAEDGNFARPCAGHRPGNDTQNHRSRFSAILGVADHSRMSLPRLLGSRAVEASSRPKVKKPTSPSCSFNGEMRNCLVTTLQICFQKQITGEVQSRPSGAEFINSELGMTLADATVDQLGTCAWPRGFLGGAEGRCVCLQVRRSSWRRRR